MCSVLLLYIHHSTYQKLLLTLTWALHPGPKLSHPSNGRRFSVIMSVRGCMPCVLLTYKEISLLVLIPTCQYHRTNIVFSNLFEQSSSFHSKYLTPFLNPRLIYFFNKMNPSGIFTVCWDGVLLYNTAQLTVQTSLSPYPTPSAQHFLTLSFVP